MKPSNYRIKPQYSNKQLGQTDFGGIYFNTPRHIDEPTTIEELALLLKNYHERGTPVTIRNTGHSMNGQSLTDGIQINVSGIRHRHFDEEKMEVTVGAGVSWNETLQTVHFPMYCPPVVPNSTDQQIHVTGQVTAGGIGVFSCKYGGLWNWIKALTLVTMRGDIIHCSRTVNPELFAYSLGGVGRIGVIGEVVMEVHKSKENVLPIELAYLSHDHCIEDAVRMMADDYFDGIVYVHSFLTPARMDFPSIPIHSNLIFLEERVDEDMDDIMAYIREHYHGGIVHLSTWPSSTSSEYRTGRDVKKRDILYFYPRSEKFGQYSGCHVWNDYVLAPGKIQEFYKHAEEMLGSRLLRHFGIKSYFHGAHLKQDADIGGYGLRNIGLTTGFRYPLSLDLETEPLAIHAGSCLTVPPSLLDEATEAVDRLNDLAYELGGKKYLYGYHSLSREQVEKHYGRQTLQQWQTIKDELDPRYLLNIGAIEHLDA